MNTAIATAQAPETAPVSQTETVPSIKARDLAPLIKAVFRAISTDTTRIHLNSLLIRVHGGKLRLVATDGHRLALVDSRVKMVGGDRDLLIRRDIVEGLQKLLTSVKKTNPEVFFGKNGLTCDGSVFRAVDAQFPPIDQVLMPTPEAAKIDCGELVKLASAFAELQRGCIISTQSKGALALTSEGAFQGRIEARSSVCVSDFSAGIQANYLRDVALGAGAGEITVFGKGTIAKPSFDPMRFEAVRSNFHYVSVVMPMRV